MRPRTDETGLRRRSAWTKYPRPNCLLARRANLFTTDNRHQTKLMEPETKPEAWPPARTTIDPNFRKSPDRFNQRSSMDFSPSKLATRSSPERPSPEASYSPAIVEATTHLLRPRQRAFRPPANSGNLARLALGHSRTKAQGERNLARNRSPSPARQPTSTPQSGMGSRYRTFERKNRKMDAANHGRLPPLLPTKLRPSRPRLRQKPNDLSGADMSVIEHVKGKKPAPTARKAIAMNQPRSRP